MIERLMVVRLQAQGCDAEAWLNGLPVARVTAAAPDACVPVHEAALAGANRLELHVGAPSAGASEVRPAPHAMAARALLLLPRIGAVVDESAARVLAAVDWSCAAGDSVGLPLRRTRDADLPIRFPRWRWADAPVVEPTPALTHAAYAFVTGLARDLGRGQTESFLAATRLRTEEIALAYQRSPESETTRLREWLEQLYASSALVWLPLAPEDFQLRHLADGRLLECLRGDGRAVLTTVPDKGGSCVVLPLKLSWVEGRFYVLR